MAFAGISCLHWQSLQALLRGQTDSTAWQLRAKQQPVPPRYIGSVLAAIGAFIGLPYDEELLRCLRSQSSPAPSLTANMRNPGAAEPAT